MLAATDSVARVVAIIGVALSAAALGWQVFVWLRAAGKVKVSLTRAHLSTWGGGTDRAVIDIRNVGRGPVFVQSVSFDLHTAVPIVWEPEGEQPDPPFQLAAGDSRRLSYKLLGVGTADGGQIQVPIRAVVHLGDGRAAWSPTNAPVFQIQVVKEPPSKSAQ